MQVGVGKWYGVGLTNEQRAAAERTIPDPIGGHGSAYYYEKILDLAPRACELNDEADRIFLIALKEKLVLENEVTRDDLLRLDRIAEYLE